MTTEQRFREGDRVEVWREKRGEWVAGTILAAEDRDGVRKYLIQMSGYMAAQADDPNSWFAADVLRPA